MSSLTEKPHNWFWFLQSKWLMVNFCKTHLSEQVHKLQGRFTSLHWLLKRSMDSRKFCGASAVPVQPAIQRLSFHVKKGWLRFNDLVTC
ncbi:unnamed protein product [Prunus armeniaca]